MRGVAGRLPDLLRSIELRSHPVETAITSR